MGAWSFLRYKDNDQVVCHTFLCKPLSEEVTLTSTADEIIQEFRWLTKEEFMQEEFLLSDESLRELLNQSL